MTQKFLIRTATQSDAHVIANLYLASRKAFIAFAPLVHSDTAIQQWVYGVLIPESQVWVVEQNDVIVGMMAIEEKKGITWIEQLYVLPEAIGKGVGSLLMVKAKSLNRPIHLRTFQENWDARRFYERQGLNVLGFTDGSGNEERCPDMLYEWKSNMLSISTKRLHLRLLQESDVDYLLELNQDPDVRQFFPEGMLNREETQFTLNIFISFYKEQNLPGFLMFVRESGEFIGRCGFGLIETGEIEVGYLLHKKFWNQGYATETLTALLDWAKKHIDTEYIIAFAPQAHHASERVMQKCGMDYYKTDTDTKRGVVCRYYRFKI